MPVLYYKDHEYRVDQDMIEVTSLTGMYPDPEWRHICACGGMHSYFVGQAPASARDFMGRLTTPTLRWIKDGEHWFEDDDEPTPYGHTECAQCGEHIIPGQTYRPGPVYIPGLKRCYIDDEPVTYDELMARLPKELRSA
jgi:hypothetical protein